jgi:hypothetical protein
MPLAVSDNALARKMGLGFRPDTSYLEWKAIGKKISLMTESITWWLGDWLVYGQEKYPERYKVAIAECGLDYQTLRNYAWVARNVHVSRRHDSLSFQHHAEVASLEDDEQIRWLTCASERNWSRNELRKNIKAARGIQDVQPENRLTLRVGPESKNLWHRAAQTAGLTTDDWIRKTLDEAAIVSIE